MSKSTRVSSPSHGSSVPHVSSPDLPDFITSSKSPKGLHVTARAGDGAVMIAMDLPKLKTEKLAGFAIERTSPSGKKTWLQNRLSFDSNYTSETTAEDRQYYDSKDAPFQKFRWLDVPGTEEHGVYTYEVTARYFAAGKALKTGDSASVAVGLGTSGYRNFDFGFTRGYLSSQAYASRFNNAPFRPEPKTLDYSTKQYEAQYEWLGYHARKLVFDFINECIADKDVTLDFFGYDIDEPDFVRALVKMGKRLRAFVDNAPLHTGDTALEPKVFELLQASAGHANVKQGHFKRYAHDKVLILKRNGKPEKVLAGSMNFSVRGMYVQANNVFVFNDEYAAMLYETAFEQAFNDPSQFPHSEIAEGWHHIDGDGIPECFVSFAPHTEGSISLTKVADAIKAAKSSVLFAVMELGGKGDVLEQLSTLTDRGIYSYGVTQNLGKLSVHKPGEQNGVIVPFSFLKKMVPQPFREEWNGGPGQVIHHKFVVVDFETDHPVAFFGSSNLADGGEASNGDNLLAVYDPRVATTFAIEAIRLVDHYQFRAALTTATKVAPLHLQGPDAPKKWYAAYYDPHSIHCKERELFAGTRKLKAVSA